MKISDLYPVSDILDTTKNKIFNFFLPDDNEEESEYPFINSDNVDTLNTDYYLQHSNDKFISPFVEKLFNDGKTPLEISSLVAVVCKNRFGEKWNKIYQALMTSYKPLENYSMEEVRTPDLTFEDTENVETDMNTERETHATNSYKGFNANDPVVINKTDGEEDVTTTGAKLKNEKHNVNTHTGTETLTRAGNIGVTTSQQMLESEFKVRQYDFYKQVFNDIDTILCLSVY